MPNPTAAFRRSSSEPSIASSASPTLPDEHIHHNARRAASCSPYHRILTASGCGGGGSSPGRESLAISPSPSPSPSGSFSSKILLRIPGWSNSCFIKMPQLYPRRERKSSGVPAHPAAESAAVRPVGTPDLQIRSVMERSEKCLPSANGGSDGRYVWAHKYQPRDLQEFICHRKCAEELLQLVIKWHGSHFIFEGPPGIGKRTMAMAFLREAFGPSKLKIKNEMKKIELKGELVASLELNVKISSQHVEVNLSEVRGHEKFVIAALMDESHSPFGKADDCNSQVILLHEAENISTDAQHYLRWLMEKYKGCKRIFFCCSDSSKLQAIKHLCKLVKLQPPSDSEIVEVLEFIARKERVALSRHLAAKIAENSNQNLRQAIRSLEATWNSNYSLKGNQEILTGWEENIAGIAKNIIEEQSPKQLYLIRGELTNFIEHNVSPGYIFRTLILELRKHLNTQLQTKIDAMYQEYNNLDNIFFVDANKPVALCHDRQGDPSSKFNDLKKNAHNFMRIEEFIAKFMSFYKYVMTKSIAGNK